MDLSAELKDYLIGAFSEIRREAQTLRGLFRFRVGSDVFELPVSHWGWQAVPGVPGAEIRPLSPEHWPAGAPVGTDYFLTRGPADCQPTDPMRLEQALRVEIIRGTVDYKKSSWGGYVRHQPGDVFTAEAGEPYTFLARTDFLHYVSFTPRITEP